jgi:hypothetical protein
MKKLLPLAAIAGALACVSVSGAQAAPVSGNVLGKLTAVSESNAVVEKAGYRHHRRYHHRKWWWKKRYYKRHRHHHRRHWH